MSTTDDYIGLDDEIEFILLFELLFLFLNLCRNGFEARAQVNSYYRT